MSLTNSEKNQRQEKDELKDTNIIERSKQLLYYENSFSLGSLKILDVYLSRIDARDSKKRTVIFTKDEFEKLLGICKVRPEQLIAYTEALNKTVNIEKNTEKGFDCIALFSRCRCYKDTKTGQWYVELTSSPEAKKLFFNLTGVGYLRYQLKNVIHLTSKYSLQLYYYLLDKQFKSSWTVSLAELKSKVFQIKKNTIYDEYKYFAKKILNPSVTELNTKTNITVDYKPIRKGKCVAEIQFIILECSQVIFEEKSQPLENPEYPKILDEFKKICNNEFTTEQLQCLYDLMQKIDTDWMKEQYSDEVEKAYTQYFTEQYHKLLARNPQNKYAYIKKMIETQDISSSSQSTVRSNAGNMQCNPSYDIEELEKRTFLDI